MSRILRTRNAVLEACTRTRSTDGAKPADDGTVRLVTSTDDAVSMHGYREILSHAQGAIDTRSLKSLLVNHKSDQLAGGIRGFTTDGHVGRADVRIDPDARMASGVSVSRAVANGDLSGVSIGYDYDPSTDADYDDDSRTVTVKRWRLLEVSLTPTPADPAGSVQHSQLSQQIRSRFGQSDTKKEDSMNITAQQLASLIKLHGRHAAFIGTRAEAGDTESVIVAAIREIVQREAAEKLARETAEAQRQVELRDNIRAMAESHQLKPEAFLEAKDLKEAGKLILAAKAAEGAARSKGLSVGGSELGGTQVTRDAGDKVLDAAQDGILSRMNPPVAGAGGSAKYADARKLFPDLGMRRLPFTDIVKKVARMSGHVEAGEWTAQDAADFFMVNSSLRGIDSRQLVRMNQRAGANQTAGMFPTLLANTIDKSLLLGYEGFGEEATSDIWASIRPVRTFEKFTAAGLSIGTLQKAVEENVLPELTLGDGGYTGSIDMYGGTLSLTLQAILSDTLDQFFRILGMAGYNAAKTFDRITYAALMNANWANDLTTGAALATAGSVDSARLGYRNKTNSAGQKLGNSPRFLLHPAPLAIAAQNAAGVYTSPGQQAPIASVVVRTWRPIESLWLDDSTVSANASDTAYFLVGDKNQSTVDKLQLEGYETPTVMEFDAGSSVARKFKIWQPMAAFVVTAADQNKNVRVLGAQKATP